MGNNAFVKWQNFKYEDSFTVPFIAVCDFLSLFKVFRFYDLRTDCEGREGNFAMKFRKNSKDEGRIVHKTSLNFQDEQKLWFLKWSDCVGMRPLGLMGTHARCARTSPDTTLVNRLGDWVTANQLQSNGHFPPSPCLVQAVYLWTVSYHIVHQLPCTMW